MKLAIGNDHVAVEMKREIKAYLEEKGIEVLDVGTNSTERFHYPISGYRVARLVADGAVDGGVLICGTGVGISLAANKVRGIRACVCSEPYTARLSKQHNNSNIIAFGARVIGIETAKMIVDEWLAASYEGGRHQTRVDMISEIEQTGALRAAGEARAPRQSRALGKPRKGITPAGPARRWKAAIASLAPHLTVHKQALRVQNRPVRCKKLAMIFFPLRLTLERKVFTLPSRTEGLVLRKL